MVEKEFVRGQLVVNHLSPYYYTGYTGWIFYLLILGKFSFVDSQQWEQNHLFLLGLLGRRNIVFARRLFHNFHYRIFCHVSFII